MTPKKNNETFAFSAILSLALLVGISVSSSVFAAEKYRVTVQVFNLGQSIGHPVMDVEEGQTARGTYSVPGSAQYTFAVLVRATADNQAMVSVQFTSGKINIQPNLLVDIGQEMSTTIDKTRMSLLVEEIEE